MRFALLVLFGCSPDGQLVDISERSEAFDNGSETEFFQVPPQDVDLLFVVDNSSSMEARLPGLQEALPALAPWLEHPELDLHIGVIAADTQHPEFSGRLREVDGYRFVHKHQEAAPLPVLWDLIGSLGVLPGSVEAGRLALSQVFSPENETWNRGFHRRIADLHVVFVTDSDDQSGTLDYSRAEFLDFSSQLKPPGQRLFMHGVIVNDPEDGLPAADEYVQYAQVSGGHIVNLLDREYVDLLQGLTLNGPVGGRSFELDEVPSSADELYIEVTGTAGENLCGNNNCGAVFDAQTNRVYFPDFELPYPGVVSITYVGSGGVGLPFYR